MKVKVKKVNALQWLLEPLEGDPTFLQKKMFGCEAVYLHGRMVLVLADSEEPWNGLMICTSREHHASLQKDYSQLKPHEILGKWLYVSQSDSQFEEVASQLVEQVRTQDVRFGIEPKSKSKTKRKK